jgi:membrane-associated phospholipid phosphatase
MVTALLPAAYVTAALIVAAIPSEQPLPEAVAVSTDDAGLAASASTESRGDGGVVLLSDVELLPEDAGPGPLGGLGPWPRQVPYAGPWDVGAVSALGVATVALQLTYRQPTTPNWSGGILFDDWVRRVLRLSSAGARAAATSISDFMLYGLAALPFLDAWLGAGLTYGRSDVAWRLTLLDAEALVATTFVTLGGQHLTLRARPFVSLCAHQPTAGECTDGSAQDTSFPSGHTSVAFTVALLECVNHAHLDIDHTGWNAVACPATLAAAGITGILRMMADRHFASDVIVGGLIGSAVGYLVPTLHFAVTQKDASSAVVPIMGPGFAGLALSGSF